MADIDIAISAYLSGSTVEEARNLTVPRITTYKFYKALFDRGIELRGRISRKIVVPDDAILDCGNCGESKAAKMFSVQSSCLTGYDISKCKECKRLDTKAARQWGAKSWESKILERAKARAKAKKVPFNLELSDILIPSHCPALGTPLVYGDHSDTASIDRIKPELGYVKGNIVILSNKANMMKSYATAEEVGRLYSWLLSLEVDDG